MVKHIQDKQKVKVLDNENVVEIYLNLKTEVENKVSENLEKGIVFINVV